MIHTGAKPVVAGENICVFQPVPHVVEGRKIVFRFEVGVVHQLYIVLIYKIFEAFF